LFGAAGLLECISDADEAILRDKIRELLLAEPVRPVGPPRKDHVSDIRGTVVYTDLNSLGYRELEHPLKSLPGFPDYRLLVAVVLVPPGRVSEELVGIARAEGADDHIPHRFCIFKDHELRSPVQGKTEFSQ